LLFGGRALSFILTSCLAAGDKLAEVIADLRADIRALSLGMVQTDIIITSDIPLKFRGGSVNASAVGQDTDVTTFVKTHIIGKIDEDWQPKLPTDALCAPGQSVSTENGLKALVERSEFGLMLMGQDNQFNIKVNVYDPAKNRTHFCARVDGIVYSNHSQANSKAERVDYMLKMAVCFIEIESGKKGMDDAELQLLAAMRAISAYISKSPLYGIVVNRTFDKARLLRVHFGNSSADGIFHPRLLPKVLAALQFGL
jgi:hypothetical protein